MGLPGEPKNRFYRLGKKGTFALLKAVSAADAKANAALAAHAAPCDAVIAYLDEGFLGPFLRTSREIPYAENAGEFGTYIDFLDGELARGALHTSAKHQVYLKLLAYVTAIETPIPWAVFGNFLEFLGGKRTGKRTVFEFGIYDKFSSANLKLENVTALVKRAKVRPRDFAVLHSSLKGLVDADLRNAVAHSAYRVDSDRKRVAIWKGVGDPPQFRTFDQIGQKYQDARYFLIGFFAGISDFAHQIHPQCPYGWHP